MHKKKVVWIQKNYRKFNFKKSGPSDIHCDNESTINTSHNPMYQLKNKHFNIHLHFVKDMVEKKTSLNYIYINRPLTN
jgi:hypothetical protein